jgi:hypothetical protein
MKKVLIALAIIALLALAYATKPDNKTCQIAAVKAVWGSVTPDANQLPIYFEQFMNTTSKAVEIDDWVFVKRIKYRTNKKAETVGFGLFRNVLIL